jgi:hypothetical protein
MFLKKASYLGVIVTFLAAATFTAPAFAQKEAPPVNDRYPIETQAYEDGCYTEWDEGPCLEACLRAVQCVESKGRPCEDAVLRRCEEDLKEPPDPEAP